MDDESVKYDSVRFMVPWNDGTNYHIMAGGFDYDNQVNGCGQNAWGSHETVANAQ
jgi:hypothetical protein